jgi:hypothetical protein
MLTTGALFHDRMVVPVGRSRWLDPTAGLPAHIAVAG